MINEDQEIVCIFAILFFWCVCVVTNCLWPLVILLLLCIFLAVRSADSTDNDDEDFKDEK